MPLHPLPHDHAYPLIRHLSRLDWHASERGDMGAEADWERDASLWDDARWDAIDAIDCQADTVNGPAMADALENMRGLEWQWGDDPATRQARHAIAQALGWSTDGRNLCDMLRSDD